MVKFAQQEEAKKDKNTRNYNLNLHLLKGIKMWKHTDLMGKERYMYPETTDH